MKKLFLAAAVAAGAYSVNPAASEAATVTAGANPEFTGAAAVRFRSFSNTGAEEIYLGVPSLGTAANRLATQQVSWSDGDTPFEFTLDLVNNTISTSILGGPPLTAAFTADPLINAVQITLNNSTANQTGDVWLSDLTVNGFSVGDLGGDDQNGFFEIVVTDLGALTNLTVAGLINRQSPFGTSQENPAINIVAGNVPAPIPLPAAAWMLLTGVAGLFAMRRRAA